MGSGLVGVLAEHPSWERDPFCAEWFCTGLGCHAAGPYDDAHEADEAHHTHVASMIAAHLVAVAGDADVREVVADVIDRRTGRHMGTGAWKPMTTEVLAAFLEAVTG